MKVGYIFSRLSKNRGYSSSVTLLGSGSKAQRTKPPIFVFDQFAWRRQCYRIFPSKVKTGEKHGYEQSNEVEEFSFINRGLTSSVQTSAMMS